MDLLSDPIYIIISPVRDEEQHIERAVESVISQTVRPVEWIIVNDGSADNTEAVVRRLAQGHSWIKIMTKKDRGFTDVGKGVAEAFKEGLRNVETKDWDFLVKLDGDIALDKEFFETLLSRFREDEALGIAGGTCYVMENEALREEKMPEFHPTAAARMYRKACFEDIGGLPETLGWDTIDLVRAQMSGWRTRRFADLKITHFRRMASRGGLWKGKVRTGRNFYITGYHPLFLVCRSIYRVKERPYLVESLGVIYGYFKAMFERLPLAVTPEEKVFLRRQQLRRLLGAKDIFMRSRVDICGIEVSNMSMKGAIRAIGGLIQNRVPSYIVTPNIDHVVKLEHDDEFKDVYKNASLVFADGMPILWAAGFLGTPLMEKISGSDLFPELCAHSAQKGYRLFFLGGRPGASQMAADILRKRYPSIRITGTYSPPFGFENDEAENKKIVDMIRTAKPDILFVGLGAPKQEKWIYKHKDEYKAPVSIGIGASFEFLSGMIKRAPRWMQKSGLEWFWRLMTEPRRLWKRYLVDDIEFFWLILKQKIKRKRAAISTIPMMAFILLAIAMIGSLLAEIEFNIAERLVDKHKWIEAESGFKKAMKLDPFDSRYPSAFGDFMLEENRPSGHDGILLKRAEALFIKALELNPCNSEYMFKLGRVRLDLFLAGRTGKGYLESAFLDFRNASRNDPNGFNISYAVGYAGLSAWDFISEDEREFILERLRYAVKIKPHYAWYIYSKLWKKTKDFGLLQKITPETLAAHKKLYSFLAVNELWQFRKSEKEKVDFYRQSGERDSYEVETLEKKRAIENIKKEGARSAVPFVAKEAWKTLIPSGGQFHKEGNIYGRGAICSAVSIPPGAAIVKIAARGLPANGIYPYMVVTLDEKEVGETFVGSPEWKEYDFKIKPDGGVKVLSITFVNDKVNKEKGEDRNLYIGEARIE